MDKYLQLAKKLKELADRGVGGEKINAEVQLQKLMKKYNISLEDIEDEKVDFVYFKTPSPYKKLMKQIIYSIIEDPDFYKQKHKHDIIIKTTPSNQILIKAKYDFYLPVYKKEQELFHTAFIHVNKLFYPFPTEINEDEEEMTLERKQELLKIANMMQGMSPTPFHKQLDK